MHHNLLGTQPRANRIEFCGRKAGRGNIMRGPIGNLVYVVAPLARGSLIVSSPWKNLLVWRSGNFLDTSCTARISPCLAMGIL
jgi:hypothetical protein